MMSDLIVSNDSFAVLKLLYDGAAIEQPYPDPQLRQLKEAGLAIYQVAGFQPVEEGKFSVHNPIYEISITEAGKAYVEWREREIEMSERRIRSLEKMSESLKKDVESAEAQIRSLNEMSSTLKAQADSAEKDARKAAIRSWIAIGISIAAIAAEVIMQLPIFSMIK